MLGRVLYESLVLFTLAWAGLFRVTLPGALWEACFGWVSLALVSFLVLTFEELV